MQVSVVAIPSVAAYRNEQALAVCGPRHFGFDCDYVPCGAAQEITSVFAAQS